MRLLACVVALALVAFAEAGFLGGSKYGSVPLPTVRGAPAPVQQMWFDQEVNHFGPEYQGKWPQRVMMNDAFAVSDDAPVFVYIGSEGTLSSKWLQAGLMFDAAQKHGARMVALEHRFYGQSVPVTDFSNEVMPLLSSQQALADLANFLRSYEDGVYNNGRVVVFGGSYGGSLSAWFRLKYPDLAVGALSSSAPLDPVVDFTQYYVAVEDSLRQYGGDQCVKDARDAFAGVELRIRINGGPRELAAELLTCGGRAPSYNSDGFEQQAFYYALSDRLADIVQYNDPAKGALNAAAVCRNLAETRPGIPFFGLAKTIREWLARAGQPCLPGQYADLLRDMNTTVIAEASGMRQWAWQTCNEFGYYQTTGEGLATKRYVSPNLFYKLCEDAYGLVNATAYLEERSAATRADYGALDFAGSNVYFTNGDVDPWAKLSLRPDSPEAEAPVAEGRYKTLMTAGTSHCEILGTKTTSTLAADRRTVIAEVGRWLKEAPAAPKRAAGTPLVSDEILRSLKLF